VPAARRLIADWLLSGMRYDADRFFAAPAVRPAQIAAWLAGFALYQWLYPNGPSWWLDFIHHDTPPYDISASIPSFARRSRSRRSRACSAVGRAPLRRELEAYDCAMRSGLSRRAVAVGGALLGPTAIVALASRAHGRGGWLDAQPSSPTGCSSTCSSSSASRSPRR
jgi:hypothetical protein